MAPLSTGPAAPGFFGSFLPPAVAARIREALAEDLEAGDVTSEATVPPDARARAMVLAKGEAVLAGLGAALTVFGHLSPRVEVEETSLLEDGTRVSAGDVLARLEGPARAILAGERTFLNLLQRLSGVATLTRRFVDAVAGTKARIADTRKTTPGWRFLEKYAVRCGGGVNHRFHLGDGILLKDNHIRLCGGVGEAVRRAREAARHVHRIEVEVTDLDGLAEALEAGADIVLLDNMTPAQVAEAVRHSGGRALIEVSGGITLANVRAYAEAGPDLISVGSLTHSAPAADISLEVEAGPPGRGERPCSS